MGHSDSMSVECSGHSFHSKSLKFGMEVKYVSVCQSVSLGSQQLAKGGCGNRSGLLQKCA